MFNGGYWRLLMSPDAIVDLSAVLESTTDSLVERDGTIRLFWRHRRALL